MSFDQSIFPLAIMARSLSMAERMSRAGSSSFFFPPFSSRYFEQVLCHKTSAAAVTSKCREIGKLQRERPWSGRRLRLRKSADLLAGAEMSAVN